LTLEHLITHEVDRLMNAIRRGSSSGDTYSSSAEAYLAWSFAYLAEHLKRSSKGIKRAQASTYASADFSRQSLATQHHWRETASYERQGNRRPCAYVEKTRGCGGGVALHFADVRRLPASKSRAGMRHESSGHEQLLVGVYHSAVAFTFLLTA
jgi:hypothetical protein